MRRAAVSTTANIAEGFGRYSYQENIQFCRQSRGSVYELRDHFTTALDAGYISQEEFAVLEEQAMSVIKLLNGLPPGHKEPEGESEELSVLLNMMRIGFSNFHFHFSIFF
jgi:hypothetical protein